MPQILGNVGTRIREVRVKAGLSQEVLAELADVSTSYVGQIERGDKRGSVEALSKIAKALQIPLSAILESHEIREPKAAYGEKRKWKQLVRLSENADDEILEHLLKTLRLFKNRKNK